MHKPTVSFIIVNYFLADKISVAVASIEDTTAICFEIIIVDNSNDNGELAKLKDKLAGRTTIVDAKGNNGFGAGCNLGAEIAQGKYLFFLNPDAAFLENDTVARFIDHLENDVNAGVIGGRLVNADRTEGHSTNEFPSIRLPMKRIKGLLYNTVRNLLGQPKLAGPKKKVTDAKIVDSICGAAMLISCDDFRRLDGFDIRYFMYSEEIDLQYRLKNLTGKSAKVLPIDIFHEDGGTNISNARRWIMIEAGNLRFVKTHLQTSEYFCYWLLTLLYRTADCAILLMSGNWAGFSVSAKVTQSILRRHPFDKLLSSTRI